MVESRVELDHEAVLHYLFCLWRDLQGCRVGNGRRLARSKELLSLWSHAGKLVRPLKAFRLDMPAKHPTRVCRSRLCREGQIRKSRGGPRRTESQTPVDRITCVYAGARSRAG